MLNPLLYPLEDKLHLEAKPPERRDIAESLTFKTGEHNYGFNPYSSKCGVSRGVRTRDLVVASRVFYH